MSIGKDDFAGGQTLRDRVSAQEAAAMSRLSGFDPAGGSLRPEGLVAEVTTGAPLAGATPEQTPFGFAAQQSVQILARDGAGLMHRFLRLEGTWSDAEGVALAVPVESVPLRMVPHVVYPTTGSEAKLMAYEPASPTTKMRPLGMKGPSDYDEATEPEVSPVGTHPAQRIFNLRAVADSYGWPWRARYPNPGDPWTPPDPAPWEVVAYNSPAGPWGYTNLLFHPAATPGQLCFTYDVAAGVSLAGKQYLVLDIVLEFGGADPSQAVQVSGKFTNGEQTVWASGWELVLYQNHAPSEVAFDPVVDQIRSFAIPRLDSSGVVNRVVFNLGTLGETVLTGLGLRTASYFVPPTGYYAFWLYSEPFATDWKFQGNLLLPAASFQWGDWYDSLPPNAGSRGTSAVTLETFPETKESFTPARPTMSYRYCFCGRDKLSVPGFTHLISNPSLESSAEVFADPWQQQQVQITLPQDPETQARPREEYGDYLTHVLVYRSLHDGETDTQLEYEFLRAEPVADTVTITDSGAGDNFLVDEVEVPQYQELSNDYPSSARCVAFSQRRVWAACLDWEEGSGAWRRPTAIMVSSEEKPWAFPTTVDEETSLVTDGVELDGYAQNGSEVRGLLARNDDVFVFLDSEFFVVRGSTPLGPGYQFTRVDSVGCRSARTLVDCRSMLVWHSGAHFYAYSGGLAQPISRHRIDSTKIAWEQPHNAVYWQEKYLFFCHYDGQPSLLVYDLSTGGWRGRASQAYDLVGICTPGDMDEVYGVTAQGHCVSLFGGAEDFGAAAPVREVHTQYWTVSPPGKEVQVAFACLEVVTDSARGETLDLTIRTQGRSCRHVARALTVTKDRTYYEVPVNLKADAVKLEISYTGTNPPEIHFLGFAPDPVPTQ